MFLSEHRKDFKYVRKFCNTRGEGKILMKIGNRKIGFIAFLLFLIVLLIVSLIMSVNIGSVKIPPKEILNIILFKTGLSDNPPGVPDTVANIIWVIRLPRLILGVAVGIGLAVSGVVMQAVVQNPLADPYVLGISSGASLGATLGIVLGIGSSLGPNYVGLMAFIMAFGVALLVMILSNIGGRSTSTKLLLAGMALSTVAGSFSNLLIFLSRNRDAIRSVSFWTMGSLGGAKWEQMPVLYLIIAASFIFLLFQYRNLNLMLLGDEAAISLGVDLQKYRQIFLLVCSLMIGFIVYHSGVIGFVGLIIPHILRLLLGTDHKRLLPASALAGAILLVWADGISRIMVPGAEVPIGVVISIVGAPLFIYLVVSRSYGGGGA